MNKPAGHPIRTDAAARISYLDAAAAQLWPGAERVRSRAESRAPGELLIAPGTRLPRVLLPAANPRAAANAVLAQGVGSGLSARLQRRALAAVCRAGLAPRVMPHRLRPDASKPSIADHLAEVLGRPVVLGMALTPQRANRKPVLQLLDPAGRTLAWAKIGMGGLTSALVRDEGDALQQLTGADRPELRVPKILHRGEWHGMQILVLSALPTAGATRASTTALTAAMRAVSVTPLRSTTNVGNYALVLERRANELYEQVDEADQAILDQLLRVLADLTAACVHHQLITASWHGDWTPWNCGQRDGVVLVWDWERAASGVPQGFDALHYRMQDALVNGGVAHPVAARDCIEGAPETLAVWEVRPEAARLVAALYLTEIALRYIADDQRAAGGYGGRVETWITPALEGYRESASF